MSHHLSRDVTQGPLIMRFALARSLPRTYMPVPSHMYVLVSCCSLHMSPNSFVSEYIKSIAKTKDPACFQRSLPRTIMPISVDAAASHVMHYDMSI
eukprot:9751088-Karenia_brevis.AAC.1